MQNETYRGYLIVQVPIDSAVIYAPDGEPVDTVEASKAKQTIDSWVSAP